jgi:hypothetical protein
MKGKGVLFLLAVWLALPAAAQSPSRIRGHYVEFRTADVYTGPCFANAEVNLTGHEAVLAWRVDRGEWNGVSLGGLSVVAVVRASATLGDPYTNPLPAKAVLILDERANDAQRAALTDFARSQSGGLLRDILATETSPIRFATDVGGRHGYITLEAGNLARLSTRAIGGEDHFCNNEEVFYQPLASNLDHAMPAVATNSKYTGNHLGITWTESGRRGSFVATFAF